MTDSRSDPPKGAERPSRASAPTPPPLRTRFDLGRQKGRGKPPHQTAARAKPTFRPRGR